MSDRRLAGPGIVAIGLGLAAWRVRPPAPGQPAGFLVVNLGLVLSGLLLVILAGVRRGGDGPEHRMPSGSKAGDPSPAGFPFLGAVLGTGVVAFGPHLAVVFAGAMLTAWSAWVLERGSGLAGRLPLAPALTLLLVPLYWLLDTIAGPESLAIRALPQIPMSPAAERLAAPGLLVVSWALSGLWPFHRQLPGALTAPACGLLLYRVGLEVMPDGLAHWRPAAFPVLVVGIWHAALGGRPELLAVGGGLLGLASLNDDGIAGAAWLLAAGVGLEVLRRTRVDSKAARVIVAVLAAWGGFEAATGGLRAEVVYTVLAAAGVAVALKSGPSDRLLTPRPPPPAGGDAPPPT